MDDAPAAARPEARRTTARLTRRDMVAAFRLHWRARTFQWKAVPWAVVAMLGAAALPGVLDRAPGLRMHWGFALYFAPVWWAGMGWLVQPLIGARAFARQGGLGEQRLAWDDEGFEALREGVSSRVAWTRVTRWREAPGAALAYMTESCFVPFPAREMDPADLASLRATAARAGVRGAARPLTPSPS